MREILFRGKRLDNCEWALGYLFKAFGNTHILSKESSSSIPFDIPEIIPETVGQYTGLTDKNGVKIFEGDIVNYGNGQGYIAWREDFVAFMCVEENGGYYEWFSNMEDIEVIGNIHDNPELLKGEWK